MFDGKVDGHCRSQRLAEIHQPRRIDVRAFDQECPSGPTVCSESLFRWSPSIAAVAAVIDEQHLQPVPMKRRGQGNAMRSIPCVPVEDDNRHARQRPFHREEPAIQSEPVDSLEAHGLDVRSTDCISGGYVSRREVDQSPLLRPYQREYDYNHDGNRYGRADHRTIHLEIACIASRRSRQAARKEAGREGPPYFSPSRCFTFGQSRLSAMKPATSRHCRNGLVARSTPIVELGRAP